LSNEAKEDLIRIHPFGIAKFGEAQVDKCFHSFYEAFDIISQRPFSVESIDYIKTGYRLGVFLLTYAIHLLTKVCQL